MFPRPENIHISGISIQSTCQVERRKDPRKRSMYINFGESLKRKAMA